MFDVDIGITIPFQLLEDGSPFSLVGTQAVELLTADGAVLALTVTMAEEGLAELLVAAGSLTAGFKRANVRVTFDATHVYHFETFQFHVSPLFA